MDEITKKVIGQRINEVLLKKDVKQKDLAKAIEVTDNTISYFVNGSRTPNTEQIIKIAKFLDVSADYLLGLSPNMSADIELRRIYEYVGFDDLIIETIRDTNNVIKKYYKERFSISNSDLNVQDLPLLTSFALDLVRYARLYRVLCNDLMSNKDASTIALDFVQGVMHCVSGRSRDAMLKEIISLSYNNKTTDFFADTENSDEE